MPSTAGSRPPVFLGDAARIEAAGGPGGRFTLAGAEGRHASTVRRLAPGERVDVTDGAGLLAECAVAAARSGAGELDLEVLGLRRECPPACLVTVVQAILKGDRGELAVELMTEVGIDTIVPWAAERSIARWRPGREDKALSRWRTAAREAAKQARRNRFPEVTPQATTIDAAALVACADLALLLDAQAGQRLAATALPAAGQIVLVVGPEGGIGPAEYADLTAAGAHPVRLGPTVLRGSTAGAVAGALVLSGCGRWAAD
ncbi:MAG TPA: 16S rRNA (uracil(1498)-N(3))-methyltransferase [Streptosporangiaceae bacterium]|nr:16S rRNA (uracil(1498)-N(3))-methyltransferase [Streptosporangiaceae bacterium]